MKRVATAGCVAAVALTWALNGTPAPAPQARMPSDFKAAVANDAKRGAQWERVSEAFVYGGVVHVRDKTGFVHAREYTAHERCAYCGFRPSPNAKNPEDQKRLQVHHGRRAFKDMNSDQRGTDEPEGEYDPNNLIALCERHPSNHHLNIGHMGNFKLENPNVFADCAKHEKDMRKAGTWPDGEGDRHGK